eukprot:jgi/Mesvir1/28084/Mv04675-RA.1
MVGLNPCCGLHALDNEAGTERQKTNSQPLHELVAPHPDSIVLVGHSAKMEYMGNETGEWIDRHATVMRFNTNWREDQRHLAGSKRDVWVTGDYRSACGCLYPSCCSPEQLAALWERVGPHAKLYNGNRPDGHEQRSGMAFTHWSSGPFLWNYYLWRKSHDHPHMRTAFPYLKPTRTGMTGLFGLLIHNVAPKVVGFDTGGCLHAHYYEVLHARDLFAQKKGDVLIPVKPLNHYRHEAAILSELNEAGLIRIVEPPVAEKCPDGVVKAVHHTLPQPGLRGPSPLGGTLATPASSGAPIDT